MNEEHSPRWPRRGDRLFLAKTWTLDASIVRDPGERFYRMPMGYKRAGDLLIEQAASDLRDRPNVIYAALFCYRQSIELFLKKIISDFGGDITAKRAPLTHELSELWGAFVEIVRARGRDDEDGVAVVGELVLEMHEADRKSDGFRYPTDRKEAPFRFGDRGIDLENIHDVMKGLANFFDAVHTAFAHEDDMRVEGEY